MKMHRICALAWFPVFAALLAGMALAQTEDVFSFVPVGGKTLLAEVTRDAPAEEVRGLLIGKRTRQEWLSYLQGRGAAAPVLQDLGDYELRTLAGYLAANMPLPANRIPAEPGKANWNKILPPDGRDMVMENCQFCHIITVVVTQEKTRVAWLGLMNKPSHIEIELTPEQREALAGYLVLNAAIPIDLVPEDLRAGGASY